MKKFLLADFLFALVLLLAAEIGVRVFLPHDVSGRFSYGYDRDSGFVETNDGRVHLVRAGGRRFYPQTFELRCPADTFRVMVIGDSVPRGPSLKQAYAYQLQEVLRDRGIKAEVINLAVPGFGVRRTQLVMRKILQYDPSLIILHLNDSNEYEDEREYRRSQDFKGWHPRHWLMKSFILARAYEIKTEKVLWRLLPDKIRCQNAVNDADAEVQACLDQGKQELWKKLVWEKTDETVALAREKGIPLVLLTQGDFDNGRITDHDLDVLGRSLEGPGIFLVSMKELFSHLEPLKDYFADSSHLTPAGHRVLTQALTDLIHQRLVMKIELGKRVEREK